MMFNYLSVLVLPSLTTRPSNQTVLEASNVTFHCTAIGNPVPKVTWTKDGKTLASGETLSIKTNRNASGVYWCSADNGLNSTINASAHLDVQCKYNGYSLKCKVKCDKLRDFDLLFVTFL